MLFMAACLMFLRVAAKCCGEETDYVQQNIDSSSSVAEEEDGVSMALRICFAYVLLLLIICHILEGCQLD